MFTDLADLGDAAELRAWTDRIAEAVRVVEAGWTGEPLSASAWAVISAVCGELA